VRCISEDEATVVEGVIVLTRYSFVKRLVEGMELGGERVVHTNIKNEKGTQIQILD
jgi:hypothetical protein